MPAVWTRRGWASAVLRPAAALFGAVVALRRACYRRGWLTSVRAGAPVVVIGNISVGGTGKTPMTGWLADRLVRAGRIPAIVSRGYAGRRQTVPVRVAPGSDAAEVGDEPVMLAQQAGCPVWVCVDRARAALKAAEEGAELILSDDGLQHYRMARDLEFCVIDGGRGLGNGRLLPAGPLREPARRLAEVDEVLVQGAPGEFRGLGFELRIDHAVPLGGTGRRSLEEFAGQKVLALAGIGAPERFHAALQSAGLDVVPAPVPDHGRTALDKLLAQGLPVLMTAKDAVKYPGVSADNLWWVPAHVVMSETSAKKILGHVLGLLGRGN